MHCYSHAKVLPLPLPHAHRQTILDVSGQVPPEVITNLLQACKTRGFQGLQDKVCLCSRSQLVLPAWLQPCACMALGLVKAPEHGSPLPECNLMLWLLLQVNEIIASGYAAQQVLLQLQAAILEDSSLPDLGKAGAFEVMAVSDKCLVDGADEYLQLLNVSSQVQRRLLAVK
jgi:hypothetical protein